MDMIPTTPIAGLGDHEAAEREFGRPLRGTRHNAGYELVDRLRQPFGLTWTQQPGHLEAVLDRGRLPTEDPEECGLFGLTHTSHHHALPA